jgi:peptidoglycan/LPS O-acetylase OafA/YrhL
MRPPKLPRKRLFFVLVAGAAAGAVGMAMVGFFADGLTMRALLDTVLWTFWLLLFTVPIALVVGVPAYSFLRNRDWLNPISVCVTGLLAGLASQVMMYTMSGQAVPLGFLMLGGFGGLIAAAVCSLLIFGRSNSGPEPEGRKGGVDGLL